MKLISGIKHKLASVKRNMKVSNKGQASGFKNLGAGFITLVVVSYVSITLGTALGDVNVSKMVNAFTDAAIAGVPLVIIAILGLFLGVGLPALWRALSK